MILSIDKAKIVGVRAPLEGEVLDPAQIKSVSGGAPIASRRGLSVAVHAKGHSA
ncbi:hypothetical protein [Croceicoccus sp. BE223]|uniref:hypothetical protein n=1 Tax=Croceicoccus sp. BE223 TaxID=2817716 RepID=UPI0028679BE8|nr:hypothetical protein [Croceicoccus sp. BE223]MDR7101496.1 hypothetical protein [Croceicoccus sp. BE223]